MSQTIQHRRTTNPAAVVPGFAEGELGLLLGGTTVRLWSGQTAGGNVLLISSDPADGPVAGTGLARLTGATFTGPLVLTPGQQTLPAHAATIGYVNAAVPPGMLTQVDSDASLNGLGTALQPLSTSRAALTDIEAGTNTFMAITPQGLRTQLGAPVGTLGTQAKQIVQAINELDEEITNISGNLIFAGTYDPTQNHVTATANPANPYATGTLQNPSGAMVGWYLIVDTALATNPPAPAPPGPYAPGDWLLVPPGPTPAYTLLPLGSGSGPIAAAQVGYTATGNLTAVNVQDAIDELEANKIDTVTANANYLQIAGGQTMAGLFFLFGAGTVGNQPVTFTQLQAFRPPVLADQTSIIGTGVTGSILTVGTINGGTF